MEREGEGEREEDGRSEVGEGVEAGVREGRDRIGGREGGGGVRRGRRKRE